MKKKCILYSGLYCRFYRCYHFSSSWFTSMLSHRQVRQYLRVNHPWRRLILLKRASVCIFNIIQNVIDNYDFRQRMPVKQRLTIDQYKILLVEFKLLKNKIWWWTFINKYTNIIKYAHINRELLYDTLYFWSFCMYFITSTLHLKCVE